MRVNSPKPLWWACLALAAVVFASSAHSAPPYAGRTVHDVLQELRGRGVSFIYSTAVIPSDLKVTSEPSQTSALRLAAEVLAQHGLELLRVAPGSYAVVRNHRGAAPVVQSTPAAVPEQSIDEIVVSTSRYALTTEIAATHNLIAQQDLSMLPQLGEETLRAIHRLPGAASNGLSGLAAIRGGEPNETLILLDGMQLFEPFHLKHFFSPVSLLDSRIVADMDVYSGGFGAQYGTRISAAIDAHSIRPEAPHYYELGASLFHTNALTAQRFAGGDGQWLLSARRSNLDEIIHILESDFGEPQYFDVFTRLDYELSPSTQVSAAYLGSRDRISAHRRSRSESAVAEYRNNYGWATLDHQWSSTASARVIASFTDVTNNRRGHIDQAAALIGDVDDERTFHIAGLQVDGAFETADLAHRWGLSARQLSAMYDYSSNVRIEEGYPYPQSPARAIERAVSLSPDGQEYAAYWSTRAQLGRALTVDVGVRWDDENYTRANSETQLAPRLGAVYVLSPHQRFRISWGRFFQAQSINEAQIESDTNVFFPAQRADQFIVSYETDLAVGAQVRIEVYRKNYTRLRPRWENLFDPVVLAPELKPDRVLVDPERARAEGIELLVSKRTGAPWTWWFAYTWSQAKDVIDGREVARSWDQRHAISAGVHWTNDRWDITLADTYHSGWPTTPVRIVGFGDDASVEVGERNSVRFDDANSVDLRINRRVPVTLGEVDLFLEVANLFNERNPCCMSISATRTEGQLQINQQVDHWLGIVPSIGFLWRY